MEKTPKESSAAAESDRDASAHKMDAGAAFAPFRAMVESAMAEHQARAEHWLDHGAAQVAEGFRALKEWNSGTGSAMRAAMESQAGPMAEAQAAGASFFQSMTGRAL